MDTNVQAVEPAPPKLIASFVTGFNTVANHIELILFPVALDIFLWFGPHLGIKKILEPFVQQMLAIPELQTPDMSDVLKAIQTFWTYFVEKYNLFSGLRTFPVGIPSLMSGQVPQVTPIGPAPLVQVNTPLAAFAIFLLICFAGIFTGSWYFYSVAQKVFLKKTDFRVLSLGWNVIQVILLTIALLILLMVIMIPSLIINTLILLISPSFAQIFLLLLFAALAWLIMPLLFSPHGIFAFNQNVLASILTSAKVIRFSMPGSMVFFFVVLVISQGMDLLWLVPPDNSWMALVGIAGHAFTTTGLLAASFVYYGAAIKWLQEIVQQNQSPQQLNKI
jgi:hypothetical protein